MNFRLIVIPAIIIASILVFSSVDSMSMDNLCAEKGGVRNGDVCMIEVIPAEETAYEIFGIDDRLYPSTPLEISVKINDGRICDNPKESIDVRILDTATGSSVWEAGSDIQCLAAESGGYYYLISTENDPVVIDDVGRYLFRITIGSHYLEKTFRVSENSSGVSLDRTAYPVPFNSEPDVDLSRIKSMRPNTMEFFYYPNPEDTSNRDVFQKFILIRLPKHLGGAADDVSAFRAYSALSVGVHCQIKYWPDQGRQRMEDPCWGSIYRPVDGLMIMGQRPVVNTVPTALPYLDLSLDDDGSLYVEPPVWDMDKNGVIGEGRNIALEQVRQGSQILVDSYEITNPNHPSIPVDFAGQILTQINPSPNKVEVIYHDFSSSNWHGITLYISNESAQDQKYFPNLAKSNSEFWQINDTVIRVGGSAMDKNSSQPEKFRAYHVEFILDGFKFAIEGQNLEFMKKSIVSHYFPGSEYDDLFLASSTVK